MLCFITIRCMYKHITVIMLVYICVIMPNLGMDRKTPGDSLLFKTSSLVSLL